MRSFLRSERNQSFEYFILRKKSKKSIEIGKDNFTQEKMILSISYKHEKTNCPRISQRETVEYTGERERKRKRDTKFEGKRIISREERGVTRLVRHLFPSLLPLTLLKKRTLSVRVTRRGEKRR